VGELVQRVIGVMQAQFAQGHFTVTANVAASLPTVEADAVAVERAVENLLNNAIKYSGDSRRIEVDVYREAGEVVVRVRDHGIGIARRDQRRIFRKFFRVTHELGHGGYVGVESEPGQGSTFTLHFPSVPHAANEGVVDEAHSGDRGRAADAARPA
jgi:signal transduction histidine kinase